MSPSIVRVFLLLVLILHCHCQADSKEQHDSKERHDDDDDKKNMMGPGHPPMDHHGGKHHPRGRPGKHRHDDRHSEGKIPSYQMTDVCDKTIEIDEHVSAFKLQIDWDDDKVRTNNMECGLNIRAPTGQRLMVKFMRMHFKDTNCQNYVEIYDGRTKISVARPLLQKRCGSLMPSDLTTSDQDAYVLFHSSNVSEKCEFMLMVTPFHVGECHTDEFVCDNHRCIDDRLRCNGYDNCGDNSDNSYSLDCMMPRRGPHRSAQWRRCIIGGIITIVVIAIAVFVGVRCYRRRRALRLKASSVDVKAKPGFLPTVTAADKKAIEAGLANNWFVPAPQMTTPMAPPSYSEASGVPVFLTPPGTEEKEALPKTATMEEKPIV